VDLTRIHRETLLFSDYPHIPIRKSKALLLSFYLFTFSTEPGAYPDMQNILSIYLRDTTLEDLPYVVGYCGEFCDGISQQAGSRLVPGMSSFKCVGGWYTKMDSIYRSSRMTSCLIYPWTL
jgi:hypothetical protein